MQQEYTNHLINETSPYLQMHAHNPVNWHPWGEEAFEKAKKGDLPIFLSVGYSTCYWCQAMERESFTDEKVAEVMNEHFVPIKVDREQRPDVDEQYMLATQLMTGRGGWPNSVWLTPEGKPWMAGTYFPREQFLEALDRTAEMWRSRKGEVLQQADRLADAIRQVGTDAVSPGEGASAGLNERLLEEALDHYRRSYDEKHGGFGEAPKFPPYGGLRLLISEYRRTGNEDVMPMVEKTLDAMWLGGIHDHLGGGFHRYSTDARWLVPHFEKMLYDNAQLIYLYAEAHAITGRRRYREAVRDIFTWLQREMNGPDGGFYSAVNAEVDGKEGASYLWSYDQILDVLGDRGGRMFAGIYNVEPEGNYTEEATGRKTGENILHLSQPVEQIAAERDREPDTLQDRLTRMRRRLLKRRQQRKQPEIDDKILSGWNGLMVEALGHAGWRLGEQQYTDAAAHTASFLLNALRADGRLLRSYRGGEATLPGYLDDYAYLAAGLLELNRATGEAQWLTAARELADRMLDQFQDLEKGGFFFTSDEGHETLLIRSKNLSGGGNVPTPNGVAARVMLELGRLTGGAEYRRAAEATLRSFSPLMKRSPRNGESILLATSCYFDKPNGEGMTEPGAGGDMLQERGNGEQ